MEVGGSRHVIIIIIIISCYPLWASTKRRHLVLSLAILFTSLQLFPFSNASLWTDLRHVYLGLPLLLFTCGFQSKTSVSMALFPFLSVCPIHIKCIVKYYCISRIQIQAFVSPNATGDYWHIYWCQTAVWPKELTITEYPHYLFLFLQLRLYRESLLTDSFPLLSTE
jgi:ubiquitin C-terminal hydrolase